MENQQINTPSPTPMKPIKPPSRFGTWVKNNKVVVIVIALVIIALGVSAYIWVSSSNNNGNEDTTVITKKKEPAKPTTLASLTNGVMVDAALANRHTVAVMIENSQPARPQVGLTSADVVYEAVTEGGITRFMGIFSQTFPDKAGPVRSARSYFIDYLSEYDSFYAHIGGSPTALSRIGDYGIKDAANATAYHREPKAGVASEHTAFVNVAQVFDWGINTKKWPATYDFSPWIFKDPAVTTTTPAASVKINFSSTPFAVEWKFDPTTNLYSRFLAGSAHVDRVSGAQITAKTVVAMSVIHSPNPAYKGTGKESEWTMQTIGTGAATVFEDGIATKGTWKKPSRTERTRFYNEAGQEISLNRGKIWIEVVPQDGTFTQI